MACQDGQLHQVQAVLSSFTKGKQWQLLTTSINDGNDTLLHVATRNGYATILSYLLEIGGQSIINLVGEGQETALHEACYIGDAAVVKVLLDHGACVNVKSIVSMLIYQSRRRGQV
eukprot:m.157802 g.157802  ORF g.157802 m.157802 type:complete len:116 (+) comp16456_c0_seq19:173-520(+)